MPQAHAADASFLVPTREAFLKRLDLSQPALAAVKAALEKGDTDAAASTYVTHFRTKTIDSPLLRDWSARTRNSKCSTVKVDRLLAGHLWDGYSVHDLPPGERLDWHDAPLSCVTRFPILGRLNHAIHHTQNPKYVRFVVDHIVEYMHAFPIDEFVGKKTTQGWTNHTTVAKPWYWCMIPERLMRLSDTIALIRTFPCVTDDEIMRILRRMYQEAGFLHTEIADWVIARRHNGGCAMTKGMAQTCVILSDFPMAHEWLAHDAMLVANYIGRAFYPDGMCVELTVSYSASVAYVQQRMAYALRGETAIQGLRDRLTAIVTCLVALTDPTGWQPSFGDLGSTKLARSLHEPLADWLELPWAKSVARREDGAAAPFTVWPVPGEEQWCGYYTMRSDWTPTARYMAIDGGPWGTTHQHGDKLSFVITALGTQFVIDPRSTIYASNRPDAFISTQSSAFLHNTITVDGVDEFMGKGAVREAEEPLRNRWECGTDYTLFASDFSFRPVKPVRWERRVLFVDGQYWLLQDVLTGDQPSGEIEQNFQLDADIEVVFRATTTEARAPNGARLIFVPVEGGLTPTLTIGDTAPHTTYWPRGKPTQVLRSEDGKDQKHGRGWTCRKGHKLHPAPAVTYTGEVTLPAVLTTLIVPLDAAETIPVVGQARDGENTVWSLPTRTGTLQFTTAVDKFEVRE
ncbi:MAG: alginate lyase family protein [Lentisphaerae bacterium]|jgi:hypothetical protein|nr:alginate lyase family protein [Lentisphaerota bacterium]MBT4818723.1 alginate lyase family protein [Lentisphaerota bacterium]MBT5604309.1 alginate lyase family protein [Lentisphaerota bacterium]MBT7060279.1 alginate lyase family protein [Lentisphaerota bacterium]MBT7847554.1 alginate lyase family protein [Lentisphaerota bacterium]